MGRDGGCDRDRHGVCGCTGADLSAAQLHPRQARDDAGPDRPVGGDDAAGLHRVFACHSGVDAALRRGAACDPVFNAGSGDAGRDRPDAGRVGLDAAALPARLLRQSALCDQRNLAVDDHPCIPPWAHHGPLFIDRFRRLRRRPVVARPGRHGRLAAVFGRHLGIPHLRHDRACGCAAHAKDGAWRRGVARRLHRACPAVVVCGFHRRRLRADLHLAVCGLWRSARQR